MEKLHKGKISWVEICVCVFLRTWGSRNKYDFKCHFDGVKQIMIKCGMNNFDMNLFVLLGCVCLSQIGNKLDVFL